jgi:ClpP class serine protease
MIYNIASKNIEELAGLLKLKKSSEIIKIAQEKQTAAITDESENEWFEYMSPIKYSGIAAMIKIEGVILDEAPWTEFYGATSSTRVSTQIQRLSKDTSVKYIDLLINSPGGSASAMEEIMSLLRNSGKIIRYAYIGKMACSAGYGIASSAQKIIATSYSEIGSIGTYAELYDDRGWLEMMGVKRKVFLADISPDKIDHPAYGGGDKGESRIQESVNKTGLRFVNLVAKNRRVKPAYVLDNYGKGLVFTASEAKQRRMIDSIDDSLNLTGKYSEKRLNLNLLKSKLTNFKNSLKNLTPEEMKNMTLEELSAAVEEIVSRLMDIETRLAAVEQATGEGEATEGEATEPAASDPNDPAAESSELKRIRALDSAAVPGYEDLLRSAKYGPNKMSAIQYKLAVHDAMQAKRSGKRSEFFRNSAAASAAASGITPGSDLPADSESKQRADRIKASAEKKRLGK